MEEEKIRIDKWLWAVRIFKTRSLAAEECAKGHVTIGEVHVKASRELKGGDRKGKDVADREALFSKTIDREANVGSIGSSVCRGCYSPRSFSIVECRKGIWFRVESTGIRTSDKTGSPDD